MRIMQCKIPVNFVARGQAKAADSLYASIVGGYGWKVLVDDQGVKTTISPLEVVAPDQNDGIAFVAKDSDTLVRGLQFLANSERTRGKREFTLIERDRQDLAAMSIQWDYGDMRHRNKAAAALSTIGFNLKEFLKRGVLKTVVTVAPSTLDTIRTGGYIDRYQSVSANVEAAGRDGKLRQRGVALYVCPSVGLPLQLEWGRQYRQIGETLTFGMMATVAGKLFKN